MHRTTGLAAVLLATALAPSARAAGSDTQFWTTASVVAPLSPELSATAQISERFRESALGDDILLLRATLDLRLDKRVTVGAGLTYLRSARGHEWRPHQQVTINFAPFAFRTQLEERSIQGASRTQLRLRERAQVVLSLAAADRLVASAEFLYIVRASSQADHARSDSWRAYLALQHQFSPALSGSAGYLLIHTDRPRAPDQFTHAPQVALIWRL
ncbi:DUF2490 domain-containing protein [Novosphingobium sp. Gsoil 351]|uniref:DUF2490 domain-containing protein n=1 Tax=Novosphingobium sp. Gsoil 351 TaxID=2675225 RepID=UPI0012B460B9|nr:DUF2490 domain-containing protein [Novosphingobium sp. Gsoil 351]QGN53491.1 DUF2490 domain-containing protein [Novosphingobium sp. Gsoil 351]